MNVEVLLAYLTAGVERPSLKSNSNEGRCVCFYITTEEDFQHFKQCILNELAQAEFVSADDLEDTPQQD